MATQRPGRWPGLLTSLSSKLAILGAALILGAAIGETRIPLETVGQVLAMKVFGGSYPVDPIDQGIVWNYRFSRAIVAASCGAGLAVSGLVLQTLLRNVLADPYILGISAGASTGAVAVTIAGIGGGLVSLSAGAFVGALVAFALVIALARAAGGFAGTSTGQVILAGVAGAQLFNALTSLIIAHSANAEQARGIIFWLLGNLSGVRWPDVWLAAPVAILVFVIITVHARALDAFAFGSDAAASLGINVLKTQAILIGAAALVTAVMVSIVGAIGFVGLVVPHAARLLVGPRHGRLIPMTAITGAVFLIFADIVSRIIIPGQVLPIGVVTALVGAPAFALILVRGRGGAR
ncbi:FecCD family ABC transporter permease [Afifella sp. YEN Y35]|uniref:FecCD family ABC transporter permease n=1 Tax=Afifella sp. YEN Y35 TaxID=3388337 RepID=UPI0039E0EBFA